MSKHTSKIIFESRDSKTAGKVTMLTLALIGLGLFTKYKFQKQDKAITTLKKELEALKELKGN